MIIKVETRGLRDFAREAKKVDTALGREIRGSMLQVSRLIEKRTRAGMGRDRQAASAREGVRARATQSQAIIRTQATPPQTLGVIWGMRRRSGWFAARRYGQSSGRQFRPWVGNQWDPGETGGKPYFLGDAVNRSVDDSVDILGDALDDVARKAGFR